MGLFSEYVAEVALQCDKKGILEKATLYGVFWAARHKIFGSEIQSWYCKMHAIDSKQRVLDI